VSFIIIFGTLSFTIHAAYRYMRRTFRGLCLYVLHGHTGECCKTAEPISYRSRFRLVEQNVDQVSTHWCHLANMIERSVRAAMWHYVKLL